MTDEQFDKICKDNLATHKQASANIEKDYSHAGDGFKYGYKAGFEEGVDHALKNSIPLPEVERIINNSVIPYTAGEIIKELRKLTTPK